jgi:hypothetical protein
MGADDHQTVANLIGEFINQPGRRHRGSRYEVPDLDLAGNALEKFCHLAFNRGLTLHIPGGMENVQLGIGSPA